MNSELRILYWNINARWLEKKELSPVFIFFEEDSPFDMVVIAEPWMHPSEIPFAQIPGWSLFPSLRPSHLLSHYGGLLLYIRDHLLSSFSLISLFDESFTDIIVCKLADVTFLLCYIPPITSHVFNLPPPTPMETLEELITRYATERLLLIGDLNASMGVYRRYDDGPFMFDTRGRRLLRICRNHDLFLVNGSEEGNTGYTFLRGQSTSCLDYVICNREDANLVSMMIGPLSDLSDHRPLDLVVDVSMEVGNSSLPRELAFPAPPPYSPRPADVLVLRFVENKVPKRVGEAGSLGAPRRGGPGSAEMRSIRGLMKSVATHPLFIRSQILRRQYQNLKTRLGRERKKEKRKYQKKLFEFLEGIKGSKAYWKFFRLAMNGPAKPLLGDAVDIANTLQRNLTTLPASVSVDTALVHKMRGVLHLGPQQIHRLLDEPFTSEEIGNAISAMESSGNGEDGVSVSQLRVVGVDDITDLFLQIQLEAHPPRHWSQAHVVAVPKKNNEFRPISVLPRLRRLYTSVLAKRLYQWSEEFLALQSFQNGFRPKHRTSDNIFVLQELVRRCETSKRPLYVVFADIEKAFDRVNHTVLFGFLMAAGAWGSHMEILKALYEDARATVKIRGRFSAFFSVDMGVQQGDTISPMLFTLYISQMNLSDHNDPFLLTTAVSALLLADDLTYFSLDPSGLSRKTLALEQYAAEWQITLSASKTYTMAFGIGSPASTFYAVDLSEAPLCRVTDSVVNGFYLEAGFRWSSEEHVKRKIANAHAVISTLMVARERLGTPSPYRMFRLYVAKVESLFYYGAESCVDCPLRTWKLLDDVQIRMARFCLGVPRNTNKLLILTDLGAIPLTDRMINLALRFLVYALNCPEERPVRMAVLDSMWMWRIYKKGWYGDLRKKLGPMVELLEPVDLGLDLEDFEGNLILMLPAKHQELVVKRIAVDLLDQLRSNRYLFLSLSPPAISLF